jgi:hypothetical protein
MDPTSIASKRGPGVLGSRRQGPSATPHPQKLSSEHGDPDPRSLDSDRSSEKKSSQKPNSKKGGSKRSTKEDPPTKVDYGKFNSPGTTYKPPIPPISRQKDPLDYNLDNISEPEREQFFQELRMVAAKLPSSLPEEPERLVDAARIRSTGQTPLEFLAMVYRNPWQETRDRVAAAKASLEYIHKRFPTPSAIGADPDAPPLFDKQKLDVSQLTDAELAVLSKLLDKAKQHEPT